MVLVHYKVYYDDSDLYTIQHFVIDVDQSGPAYEAGLRTDDIITHVNDEVVCGRMHHEIVKLILSSTGHALHLRTVNSKDTSIKSNGRKRSPSKIKLRRPHLLLSGAYQQKSQFEAKGSMKSLKASSLGHGKSNVEGEPLNSGNYFRLETFGRLLEIVQRPSEVLVLFASTIHYFIT